MISSSNTLFVCTTPDVSEVAVEDFLEVVEEQLLPTLFLQVGALLLLLHAVHFT